MRNQQFYVSGKRPMDDRSRYFMRKSSIAINLYERDRLVKTAMGSNIFYSMPCNSIRLSKVVCRVINKKYTNKISWGSSFVNGTHRIGVTWSKQSASASSQNTVNPNNTKQCTFFGTKLSTPLVISWRLCDAVFVKIDSAICSFSGWVNILMGEHTSFYLYLRGND